MSQHIFTLTRDGRQFSARVNRYELDRTNSTMRIVYEYDDDNIAGDRIREIDAMFTIEDIQAAGIAPASLNHDAAAEALARLKWED